MLYTIVEDQSGESVIMQSTNPKNIMRLIVGLILAATIIVLPGCQLPWSKSHNTATKAPQVSAPSLDDDEVEQAVKSSLPAGAVLIAPLNPEGTEAVQTEDMDNDGTREIIAAYSMGEKRKAEAYAMILKQKNNTWEKIWQSGPSGYEIDCAIPADVTGDGRNELLMGWTLGASVGNGLDILSLKNGKVDKLYSTGYHKMELLNEAEDGDKRVALALWQKDTGEAFQVDVYRWDGQRLAAASEFYPDYFEKVVEYYEPLVKETPDDAFYWYYLADAQIRVGNKVDARDSINKGMSLHKGYPALGRFQQLQKRAQADDDKS
ncbi:MAG: hypothetical protein ACM3UZ_02615 [Acidobacteriota bacterium]